MLFKQTRIGQFGRPFVIYKLRSIPVGKTEPTFWGRVLRKTKLDELPQLFNIIKGEMNLVGPRPDIPGYADQLKGEDRMILSIKPGVTGLTSLKYRNEEMILSFQQNPIQYNDQVIWPDKVRINKWYVQNRNIWVDLTVLFYTFIPIAFDVDDYIARKGGS